MRNRFEVTLNGVALTSLNDQLYITDLQYDSSGFSDSATPVAKKDGMLLQNRYYQSTSVTVEFELHVYNSFARQAALMDIAKWAMDGGKLTTSDRIGQYLTVICEIPPMMKSAMEWTDTLNITFVAYNPPYWQEEIEDVLLLSGDSGAMYVHGNASTVIDAEIVAGASITEISLTVNENTIALTGLTVSAGDIVTLSHDEHGILRIYQGSTSLLNKRTGADELVAKCGEQNEVSFDTDASASCTFKARGRWY